MNINAKQPIAQVGSEPPTKQTKVGYKIVTEKIPPQPYTRKFVNLAGNVVRVVLGGRTEQPGPNNPYGMVKAAEKLAKGWLPYSECPIGKHLHIEGETPCAGPDANRPGQFGVQHPTHRAILIEDQCCPHIARAIEERQAEYTEKQLEYATSFQNPTEALIKQLEKNALADAQAAAPERTDFTKKTRGK